MYCQVIIVLIHRSVAIFPPSSNPPNPRTRVQLPPPRMPPTTTLVVTTPSARSLLTLSSTASASWPITAPAFRVSSSSTPPAVAPVPALVPSSLRGSPSTTGESPSCPSPYPLHPRFQRRLWNRTTACLVRTRYSNTRMLLSPSTTR